MTRRTINSLKSRAVCVALALLALGASSAVGLRKPTQPQFATGDYTRPGRLVRLADGRRINLRCSGQGSPTVLLEAGFGAGSNAWGRVQPQVARVTRVCAYDRAGAGFSDPAPLPRDGAAIARDLDRTLKVAGVHGPYVVVGHSAGGLYARLFAGRRLHEVVGLVFVDSSIEHQDQRMAKLFGPGAGGIEGIRRQTLHCLDVAVAGEIASRAGNETTCIPKVAGRQARMVAYRPATWRTQLSEIDTLFRETSDEVERLGPLLNGVPAIVLTASQTGAPAGAEDPGAAAWQGLHAELTHRFYQGDQRIVKSGHLMMNERPDVVASAVLELVAASRRSPRAR